MKLLLPLLCLSLFGQTSKYVAPDFKGELFGGFSSISTKPGPKLDRQSSVGWTASATTYQTFRRWGLTAEFAGNRSNGETRQDSFLFGGTRRAYERKRIAITGRILAGVTRWDPSTQAAGRFPQQNAFTFGFGNSIDAKVSERFAIRVQPGFRFIRFKEASGSKSTQLAMPLSIGIVYRFGER